jgi:hypothetical protein
MELGQPIKRHTVVPLRHPMPAQEPSYPSPLPSSQPSRQPQPSKSPEPVTPSK